MGEQAPSSEGLAGSGELELVGQWRARLDFQDGDFAAVDDLEFMYVFNAGGTLTESSNYDAAPPVPPAYGIWRRTGPDRFEAKYEFYPTSAPGGSSEITSGGGWLVRRARRVHRGDHDRRRRRHLHVDDRSTRRSTRRGTRSRAAAAPRDEASGSGSDAGAARAEVRRRHLRPRRHARRHARGHRRRDEPRAGRSEGAPAHSYGSTATSSGRGIRNLVTEALPPEMRDERAIARCYARMIADYGAHSPGQDAHVRRRPRAGARAACRRASRWPCSPTSRDELTGASSRRCSTRPTSSWSRARGRTRRSSPTRRSRCAIAARLGLPPDARGVPRRFARRHAHGRRRPG